MAAVRAELSHEVRAQRLSSQRLAGAPAPSVEAVAAHLLAVQAQDLRGARLAVRARTRDLSARDFDTALADRSMVISWLSRGALHLVCAEDYFWLHDLTTPPLLTGCLTQLAKEGISSDRAAEASGLIARWLAEEGPLTRDELASRLRTRGIPAAGQSIVHILLHATLEGLIVRGPMKGKRQAFVLVRDWLGRRPVAREREDALAELVRRYLIGHSPASEWDIARWAGLPLRDIRLGIGRVAAQLRRREDDLLVLRRAHREPAEAPARLLGAWDPLLVGWKDRTFVTREHDADVVSGGVFRPFILLHGEVAGLWRLIGRDVRLEPFDSVDPESAAALERDAQEVRDYLLLGG